MASFLVNLSGNPVVISTHTQLANQNHIVNIYIRQVKTITSRDHNRQQSPRGVIILIPIWSEQLITGRVTKVDLLIFEKQK